RSFEPQCREVRKFLGVVGARADRESACGDAVLAAIGADRAKVAGAEKGGHVRVQVGVIVASAARAAQVSAEIACVESRRGEIEHRWVVSDLARLPFHYFEHLHAFREFVASMEELKLEVEPVAGPQSLAWPIADRLERVVTEARERRRQLGARRLVGRVRARPGVSLQRCEVERLRSAQRRRVHRRAAEQGARKGCRGKRERARKQLAAMHCSSISEARADIAPWIDRRHAAGFALGRFRALACSGTPLPLSRGVGHSFHPPPSALYSDTRLRSSEPSLCASWFCVSSKVPCAVSTGVKSTRPARYWARAMSVAFRASASFFAKRGCERLSGPLRRG